MRNRHIHLPLRHTAMGGIKCLPICVPLEGEGGRRTVEERDVDEKRVRDDFGVAAVA